MGRARKRRMGAPTHAIRWGTMGFLAKLPWRGGMIGCSTSKVGIVDGYVQSLRRHGSDAKASRIKDPGALRKGGCAKPDPARRESPPCRYRGRNISLRNGWRADVIFRMSGVRSQITFGRTIFVDGGRICADYGSAAGLRCKYDICVW